MDKKQQMTRQYHTWKKIFLLDVLALLTSDTIRHGQTLSSCASQCRSVSLCIIGGKHHCVTHCVSCWKAPIITGECFVSLFLWRIIALRRVFKRISESRIRLFTAPCYSIRVFLFLFLFFFFVKYIYIFIILFYSVLVTVFAYFLSGLAPI